MGKYAVTEREISVLLNGLGWFLATYTASSDPGRVSGPPEDCYPPESDFELVKLVTEDNARDDVLPLLSEKALQMVEQQCWEDFNDNANEAENERADFLYDCAREERLFGGR